MLTGLLYKTVRETWLLVALGCVGLGLAMAAFVQILPQFQESLSGLVTQVPFLRTLLSGLMGMDVSGGLPPQLVMVVAWSHPIVLAILWGTGIALCTRIPSSEIERGTIDVLLGWPVSRTQVYLSEGLVWLAAGLLLHAGGLTGFLLGAATLPPELRPELGRTLATLVNSLALYVAVGGFAQGVATLCDRRGKATGIALAFVVASYLVQFLSALWPPAERVAFLSVMHYYQPAQILLQGGFPTPDVVVLTIAGATLWTIGCAIWVRRSVLTT